jgi:hypothetical protein
MSRGALSRGALVRIECVWRRGGLKEMLDKSNYLSRYIHIHIYL